MPRAMFHAQGFTILNDYTGGAVAKSPIAESGESGRSTTARGRSLVKPSKRDILLPLRGRRMSRFEDSDECRSPWSSVHSFRRMHAYMPKQRAMSAGVGSPSICGRVTDWAARQLAISAARSGCSPRCSARKNAAANTSPAPVGST